MSSFPPARYDRSVSSEFLECFEPGGFAGSLLEYANARFPIDFQFRKDPKTGRQWASLYVGMTAVLYVHDKGLRGTALAAPSYCESPKYGWDAAWEDPRSSSDWTSIWSGVEEYLERVIPGVMQGSRATNKEGPVQAAVSVYRGDATRALLDREVVPGFVDDPTRKRVIREFSDELMEAVLSFGIAAKGRTKFGQKCDVLALHMDGHLEAIEVKPENVASLVWVAGQATMYSKLLNYWISVDPNWSQSISAMFDQRRRLGLVREDFQKPALLPTVVPAVAFQRTATGTFVTQMFEFQKHLVATGVGDPGLRFYRTSLAGRLAPATS